MRRSEPFKRSRRIAVCLLGLAPAALLAQNGVVREGDGTMTVWITADRRRFVQRMVRLGQERDGYWQIFEGVQVGELAATEGAIFLSNALTLASP